MISLQCEVKYIPGIHGERSAVLPVHIREPVIHVGIVCVLKEEEFDQIPIMYYLRTDFCGGVQSAAALDPGVGFPVIKEKLRAGRGAELHGHLIVGNCKIIFCGRLGE